ncbi:MAG: hypothetical protein KAU23_01280, partial [Anaerolineales bacterium]|nr:hypothetical protein [Anaerolineales bacterium]
MKLRKKSRMKRFLGFGLISLVLITICLFSGIIFSIPSRTAEVFGPASPNLDPLKLYSQSLVLLLSDEQLITPSSLPAADLIFQIEEGDSLEEILTGLKNLNLVRHPAAFRAYLIYTGIDT